MFLDLKSDLEEYMVRLRVDNVDGYVLSLSDYNGNRYEKNIEFIGVDISVNDFIYLPLSVLNEKNIFTYGRVTNKARENDLIKVINKDGEFYLERYYG